jgi:hypothetical protein
MQTLKSKIDFKPLFYKGDKFIIIKRNTDVGLYPIIALRIKDKNIYGFEEDELE